jgi:hypothetical protein
MYKKFFLYSFLHMKNQWTTVSDTIQNASEISSQKKNKYELSKNRKLALAFGSIGVFLILIGVTPFLFSETTPNQYSASLLEEDISLLENAPITPNISDISFEDEDEFTSSPEEITMPILDEEPEEISFDPVPEYEDNNEGTLPYENEEVHSVPESQEEIVQEDIMNDDFYHEDESIFEDEGTLPAPTDFPVNIHVGETADPVDLARIATAEQLHSSAEKNPETGLPLFPLLIFSGIAAFCIRKKGIPVRWSKK